MFSKRNCTKNVHYLNLLLKLRFKIVIDDQICTLHINFANGTSLEKLSEGWRSGRDLSPASTKKRVIRNFVGSQNIVYASVRIAKPFSGPKSGIKCCKDLHLSRHDRLVGRHFDTQKVDQSTAGGRYQFGTAMPIWEKFRSVCIVIVTSQTVCDTNGQSCVQFDVGECHDNALTQLAVKILE